MMTSHSYLVLYSNWLFFNALQSRCFKKKLCTSVCYASSIWKSRALNCNWKINVTHSVYPIKCQIRIKHIIKVEFTINCSKIGFIIIHLGAGWDLTSSINIFHWLKSLATRLEPSVLPVLLQTSSIPSSHLFFCLPLGWFHWGTNLALF